MLFVFFQNGCFLYILIKLPRFGRFKTTNSIIQFKLLNCFNRWDLSDFEQRMAISDLWPRDTFLSTTKAPLHWLPPIYFTDIFNFHSLQLFHKTSSCMKFTQKQTKCGDQTMQAVIATIFSTITHWSAPKSAFLIH